MALRMKVSDLDFSLCLNLRRLYLGLSDSLYLTGLVEATYCV